MFTQTMLLRFSRLYIHITTIVKKKTIDFGGRGHKSSCRGRGKDGVIQSKVKPTFIGERGVRSM